MSEDTRLKELIINTLSPEQFEPITPSETEIYLVEDDAEYATVEELATKQDIINDLQQIRDNASTGANLAPQVTVNTQRIEDLTTARIPDVIYHGTPKIVGGQVSNFSTVNYLQFPFEDISRSLPFNIYFSFTTDDDVTTQQNIIDSRFGIALAIQNSKGVMALSSNGTSWDIGSVTGTNTLLPNTTYYVKYSWTGTEYNASLSTNDQSYVPDMILQSNKSPYKTTIYIGGSEGLFGPGTAHPFKGIINFTKSRVDVNGITVWEGMADVGIASRANVSLTNLDEVGEARFSDLQTAIDTKANESDLTAHTDNTTIHVTASDKIAWSQKQNTSDDGLTTTDKTIVGAINELKSNKQDKLISGTNIKTINGGDVLGEGDLKLSTYHPPILSCMWSDHLINDIQWLRADTFSWQSGDVYTVAYNTLVEEYNNIETTEHTVTKYNVTFTFKKSSNGFRIVTQEYEQQMTELYNNSGIAWYYVLDTENKRFKLPRTEWGFKGYRNTVGNDITEKLPNIKGFIPSIGIAYNETTGSSGAIYTTASSNTYGGTNQNNYKSNLNFDASRSSSTYQDNAPVQERATQMYLYFYVGEYAQTAIEQTAGLNTDLFNNKVDLNASNLSTQGRDLISSLGMPSNRFINFTLGASGTQYIAPVNGYIAVSKTATASGQYLALTNPANSLLNLLIAYGSGNTLSNWLPVKKNDVIQIDYSVAGTTNHFKFIYAEGGN